jgi:hypothetical protein
LKRIVFTLDALLLTTNCHFPALARRAAARPFNPRDRSIGMLANLRKSLRNQRQNLGRIDRNNVRGVGHI